MNRLPRYTVAFYQTSRGHEPVREWLKALPAEARRIVGEDLKTVQYGWPLGMPLIRKLEADLWEVRSTLPDGIARVLFTVQGRRVILLHAFVKKTQKTPLNELAIARKRLAELVRE
ncbi:MAG: type II toxin-antitoxin system RelE/ParE family toxin [Anaerolineales bacterium]|nr:type II toxin-antitoxin system RelE/ParE family toxin [Anaerolineales bacterium]